MHSLSVTLMCAYNAFPRFFCHTGEPDIQEYAPFQNIFTGMFSCTLFSYFGKGGGHFYRRVLFNKPSIRCRFRTILLKKNTGVLFCCITYHTSHIIDLEKIQTKYR